MYAITDKTFVTYPGGSGGDLFTASCNKIQINENHLFHTEHGIGYFRQPPYTIKKFDNKVELKEIVLDELVQRFNYRYLSTHLIDELKNHNTYNIVISDPISLKKIVCRQLVLQVHEFKNPILIKSLKNLCDKGKYTQAAELFFRHSVKSAEFLNTKRMSFSYNQCTTFDFSGIFQNQFIVNHDDPEVNDIFSKNHKIWLDYQKTPSKAEVIARLEKSIPQQLNDYLKNNDIKK